MSNEEFVVQEKIHGANFSFYCDGETVLCGKRSSILQGEEIGQFFNADSLLSQHKSKILEIFNHVRLIKFFDKESTDVTSISIHGELYGGTYPHDNVDKNNSAKKVQKGVFYSPDNEFVAFDMKVNEEYVNIDHMNEWLDRSGLTRLEILKRGKLNECLDYPNDFNSHLHKCFPELDNNTCEGVVIKTVNPVRFPSGDRPIVKNKNAKWSEKKKGEGKSVQKELPEHVKKHVLIGQEYITENRLRNVLSYIGPIVEVKKAFGQILGAFNKDVIKDLMVENEEFLDLEKQDRKIVTSMLKGLSAEMIRPNFANILDGEF